MTDTTLKDTIKRELPAYLREDPAFRAFVLDLTREAYADRAQTNDWFQQAMAELRAGRARADERWEAYLRDREEQSRKWEAQERKWQEQKQEQERKWQEQKQEQERKWQEQKQEQERKWQEQKQEQERKWEAQERKWEAQERKWEEQSRKWDEQKQEQNRKWDEQNRKWDENQAEIRQNHVEIRQNQAEIRELNKAVVAMAKKHERSIGALGARWGLQSEKAFRDALAGILEENFGVEVINYNGYDDSGEVFGKPEQVELDVIIKNGLLILCELKSSIDKGGMYLFERKARFYEREHQRQATRLIAISPMIEPKAYKVAERLGIDCYGDSLEVERL